MSREGNLVKNTAIIALGTFLPKFLTILITPILTAKLLTVEYGQYDLITTIESLLLPAVTLQVSSAAFRFLIDVKNDLEKSKTVISTIFAFVVPVSIVSGILYYFIAGSKLGVNGLLVCLYFLSDILLQTIQQIIRGLGKNFLYSLSSMIRSIGNVAFIAIMTGVFGTNNYGLSGVVIAMFIATILAFLFLLLKAEIWRYIDIKRVSGKELKRLLAYSWPMVPNNLSGWVLRLSDRIIITAVCGIEANAMYAVANKMPTIFNSFQNTFSLAWQENASIASKDDDKDAYYSKMCDWVFRLLIGLMAALIVFTPVLWKLLVKGDYGDAYFQVSLLYMGMLFQCMSLTLGGIYIAHMKTKSVGITTMMAALINLIIDILLVHSIGIWAGSLSTMISYLFLFIYRLVDIQKFQKVYFDKKKIFLGIVLISIMSLFNYFRSLKFDMLNIIICFIVIVIFDRDIIISVVRMLGKRVKRHT